VVTGVSYEYTAFIFTVKVGKMRVISGRMGNGSRKTEMVRDMDEDKFLSPHNTMMRNGSSF
jgi:hypothetical protein